VTGTKRSLAGKFEPPDGPAGEPLGTVGSCADAAFGSAVLATGGGAEFCVERHPAVATATISMLFGFIPELLGCAN
jgi:hypothetical protein